MKNIEPIIKNQGLSNSWSQGNPERDIVHPMTQSSTMNIKTEAQDNIDVDEDSMNALENELITSENEMWSKFNAFQNDTDEQYYAYDGMDFTAETESYNLFEERPLQNSEKLKRKRRGRKPVPKTLPLVSVCFPIFILQAENVLNSS